MPLPAGHAAAQALKAFALAALLSLAPAAPAGADEAARPSDASAAPGAEWWRGRLDFQGLLGLRYLYAPYIKRETLEYLYVLTPQVHIIKDPAYGLDVTALADSFDTRNHLKGFQSTGLGTVSAEPVLNWNKLFLDAFWQDRAKSLGLSVRAGILPIELPSFTLPLPLGQVAGIAGVRVVGQMPAGWRAVAFTGNLDTSQPQNLSYRFPGMGREYNYRDFSAERATNSMRTSAGVYAWDSNCRGFNNDRLSVYGNHQQALLRGLLTPRVYAQYYPSLDAFAVGLIETQWRLLSGKLVLRPGYFYYNRSPQVVQLPNSNLFAPGTDRNNGYLMAEYAFPRPGDIVYAGFETGLKKFVAQQGVRFEAGIIIKLTKPSFIP